MLWLLNIHLTIVWKVKISRYILAIKWLLKNHPSILKTLSFYPYRLIRLLCAMIKKVNLVFSLWFQNLLIAVMMVLVCMVVLNIQSAKTVKLISTIVGILNLASSHKLGIAITYLGGLLLLVTARNPMSIMMKLYGLRRLVKFV